MHQRLSLVADEICRILETLLDEYESQVSGSREEIERHRRPLDVTLTTELHTTGIFSRSLVTLCFTFNRKPQSIKVTYKQPNVTASVCSGAALHSFLIYQDSLTDGITQG